MKECEKKAGLAHRITLRAGKSCYSSFARLSCLISRWLFKSSAPHLVFRLLEFLAFQTKHLIAAMHSFILRI
jgi:hypothetical protein